MSASKRNHLFHISVCVDMHLKVCIHSNTLTLALTHILHMPHGKPTSTLSQQKRWEQKECIFSLRLALHEYFKQATWFLSGTRHKGEVSGGARGWRDQKWNLRLGLPGTTCLQWQTHTVPCSLGGDRGPVKPNLSMSVCVCARYATGAHFAAENHNYKHRPVFALLIVCVCVDGEDGCACGHTRHSKSAIKPKWRWGIKLGCVEWYLGSRKMRRWDREAVRCRNSFRWEKWGNIKLEWRLCLILWSGQQYLGRAPILTQK